MRRLRITLSGCVLGFLAVAGAALTSVPAWAAGVEGWTLQESSGEVRLVRNGISPISLTVGDRLEGGDWIETGPDGRALLVRAKDRILVAPGSRVGLPREIDGRFATRILQTLGTILLTVERQARQHFEVETPLLAAVVKGTTFTVSVEGDRALVHVVEGLVEVRDLALGQKGLVRPGETGSVRARGSGVHIFGAGRQPAAPAPTGAEQTRTDTTGGGSPQKRAGAKGRDTAPTSTTNAPINGAPKAVIRQALGGQPLDLGRSTGGLIRETKEKLEKSEERAESERQRLAKRSDGVATEAASATGQAKAIGHKAKGVTSSGVTSTKSLSKSFSKAAKALSNGLNRLSRTSSIGGATAGKHMSGHKQHRGKRFRSGSTASLSSSGDLLAPLVDTITTTTDPIVSTVDSTTSGLGLP